MRNTNRILCTSTPYITPYSVHTTLYIIRFGPVVFDSPPFRPNLSSSFQLPPAGNGPRPPEHRPDRRATNDGRRHRRSNPAGCASGAHTRTDCVIRLRGSLRKQPIEWGSKPGIRGQTHSQLNKQLCGQPFYNASRLVDDPRPVAAADSQPNRGERFISDSRSPDTVSFGHLPRWHHASQHSVTGVAVGYVPAPARLERNRPSGS